MGAASREVVQGETAAPAVWVPAPLLPPFSGAAVSGSRQSACSEVHREQVVIGGGWEGDQGPHDRSPDVVSVGGVDPESQRPGELQGQEGGGGLLRNIWDCPAGSRFTWSRVISGLQGSSNLGLEEKPLEANSRQHTEASLNSAAREQRPSAGLALFLFCLVPRPWRD